MIKTWKPINFRGSMNYDPRGELKERIKHAREASSESYVAIPMELAVALSELRECGTTLVSVYPNGKQVTYICRKPEGHTYTPRHYNGYLSWEQDESILVKQMAP